MTTAVAHPKITRYNALIIAFATFGSITYGYCASIIGTTLGQPTFLAYFNLDTASNAPQMIGAINGLFQGGGLLGTFFGGWLGDRVGRCKAIAAACILSIIGGALQAGSAHIAMFLVARFITGFGVGALVMLVPLWQSEVAPPHARGLLVGLHGVSILIGYTSSTWIGVGFYYVHASGAQWRVPLAIQVIPALILLGGIFYIPESPRWLIAHNRIEEGRQILERIHPVAGDDKVSLAQEEFIQIQSQLEIDRALPSSWGSIFTVPHYRKRAIIGFLTLLAGQLTGTLVINNYGPSLYATLGFDTAKTLIISGGWITEGLFANMLNAYLLDKIGRKWLMMIGLSGCCLALVGEAIMLALFQGTDNKGGNGAGVFFLFLHLAFYGSCVDASTYVYASEIWPTHLRAKGFAVSVSGLFVGSLILLCSAPTAFANIGWKFYLVMIITTFLNIFVVAFYFPETKGLPLEEVALRFGDEITGKLARGEDEEVGVIVVAPVKIGEKGRTESESEAASSVKGLKV